MTFASHPQVRMAQAKDLDPIARIHVTSWQTAYQGLMPASYLNAQDEGERRALWERYIGRPNAPLYVFANHEGPAGFCHVMPSRDPDAAGAAEIVAVYVDPAYTRRGAGRALVSASMTFAHAQHCPSLTLWVLALNHPARHFYERMGFHADGAEKSITIAGSSLMEVRYRWFCSPQHSAKCSTGLAE